MKRWIAALLRHEAALAGAVFGCAFSLAGSAVAYEGETGTSCPANEHVDFTPVFIRSASVEPERIATSWGLADLRNMEAPWNTDWGHNVVGQTLLYWHPSASGAPVSIMVSVPLSENAGHIMAIPAATWNVQLTVAYGPGLDDPQGCVANSVSSFGTVVLAKPPTKQQVRLAAKKR